MEKITRTEEEMREKLKHLEAMFPNPEYAEYRDFIRGAISTIYFYLKEVNPYTGMDLGK